MTLSVSNGTLTLASTAGLSFTGGSDGTADVTMTFSGTAAAINTALGSGLTYNPTADYHGADAISVNVTDNGETGTGPVGTDSDSVGITVNSVNDAPSGTDTTVTGSEDDPYVFTLADFGFSDVHDAPDNFNAVSILTFPAAGTLFLDSDGPGGSPPVDLSTVGAGVFVSAADIVAGHLYFQPVMDAFGNNYASFTFKVQDDGGITNGGVDLDPTANTMTIDIAPDNQPPQVDLNGGANAGNDFATIFTEDGAAVLVTSGSGDMVAEPDSVTLGDRIEKLTVTLTDRVAGDDLSFNAPLPGGFSAVTTNGAGFIEIEITGTGTGPDYSSILASIVYSTTSQDPDVGGTHMTRTITVVANDGDLDSITRTSTINIVAVDDLPVAQPDAFTITESELITNGDLFAANGSGPDSDPDGPPLTISAVNGSGANVGSQFTLGSGALLTVHSDGTFDYDPNGVFLPTPTPGSGASNTPSHDGFTYTIAGGNTVTVNITLTGLDTDDLLRGTSGVDMLYGGVGNDLYFVENAGDRTIENVGEGNDRVMTSVSYVLSSTEVEELTTTNHLGTGAINLAGNGFNNLIIGNDGANILNGADGNDTIIGRAGNDIIYGGNGADDLYGNTGNDFYFVDSADQVHELVGEGSDRVFAGASFVLAAGAEVEILSTDNDAGTAAINLTGNGFANAIYGNAGANILNGGAGADLLAGRGGDDMYYVDNGLDVVAECAAQGNDRVFSSVSYALAAGASVEILSTDFNAGTSAIDLTGNELAQAIFGNDGKNIITGGGGADSLVGFGGDDNYFVSNSSTSVIEAVGGGVDRVFTSVSLALTAGSEVELFTTDWQAGTDAINLTGNEFANTIYGNAGNNVLDGKGGNDSLVGLAGADTFQFTTALGAGNVDVVFGFEHGTDKIALDDAVFAAIGPLGALNANAFVVGSAAADASDRIIYNNLTGQLYYDADGNGAGAAIQFATLSPGLSLTASDFQVI